MKIKKVISGKWFAIIGILAVAVIGIIYGMAINNSPESRVSRQLELGQKYLEEQNYEQAIAAFEEVIAIDPKNVEAYLGAADAYIAIGDINMALSILQTGYEETADERIQEKIRSLENAIAQEMESETVNSNAEGLVQETIVEEDTAEATSIEESTEESTETESEESEAGSEGETEQKAAGETEESNEAETKTTGFVITEEEFQYRVMFNLPVDLPAVDDEFSRELVAAIDSILAGQGRVKEYSGPDMIGRCYPIRFGEDVQSSAEGIVMDMESYFMDGGYRYDIHHVKKADNGYMVTYSIE